MSAGALMVVTRLQCLFLLLPPIIENPRWDALHPLPGSPGSPAQLGWPFTLGAGEKARQVPVGTGGGLTLCLLSRPLQAPSPDVDTPHPKANPHLQTGSQRHAWRAEATHPLEAELDAPPPMGSPSLCGMTLRNVVRMVPSTSPLQVGCEGESTILLIPSQSCTLPTVDSAPDCGSVRLCSSDKAQ